MSFEMTEIGPPLTEERIDRLERDLGLKLLPEYRAFLLKYNGGRPNPADFPIRGLENNPFGGICNFCGLDSNIKTTNLDWNYVTLKGRIPSNLLPIAQDGSGNIICLSESGWDTGAVYFWAHDYEHHPPSYDNVYLIAPSFSEFLDSIHYEDISAEVARAIGNKLPQRPRLQTG